MPFAFGMVNMFLPVDRFSSCNNATYFASQVVTSFAAMELPNWRGLELGLGFVRFLVNSLYISSLLFFCRVP